MGCKDCESELFIHNYRFLLQNQAIGNTTIGIIACPHHYKQLANALTFFTKDELAALRDSLLESRGLLSPKVFNPLLHKIRNALEMSK